MVGHGRGAGARGGPLSGEGEGGRPDFVCRSELAASHACGHIMGSLALASFTATFEGGILSRLDFETAVVTSAAMFPGAGPRNLHHARQ